MEKKASLQRSALFLALIGLALTAGSVFALAVPGDPAPVGIQPTEELQSLAAGSPTTLVDVQVVQPQSLDPHWIYDTSSQRPVLQIYETLTMVARNGTDALVPGLATGWQASPDTRTFTFTVQTGVTFQAGGTLEAHDAAYSLRRALLQDRTDGPMWMLLEMLFGVYDVNDIPGDDLEKCHAVIDAVAYDDVARTVTLHLDRPDAILPRILAQPFGAVLDQEWMAANGGWSGSCTNWRDYHDPSPDESNLFDHANGTGPFRLGGWTNGMVQLLRHDGYWRTQPAWPEGPSGRAALEMVVLQYVTEWDARRDLLLHGEADLADVAGDQVADVDPHVWGMYDGMVDTAPALVNPVTGTLRLYRNLPQASQAPYLFCYELSTDANPYIGSGALDGDGIPPDFFADPHVRKAFNYAMDWEAVIEGAYNGEALRSRGPIPSGMMGYTDTQATYPYSPALSALEFQQAFGGQLWSQGFSMTLAYNDGNVTRQWMADVLADGVETIHGSFHLNVISMPWADLLADRRSRRLPMYGGGWLQDYHHPNNWVHPYLYSQGAYAGFQSFPPAMAASFDAKVEACALVAEEAEARGCYEELQNLSYDQAAAMWGVQPLVRRYIRTEVRGYTFHPALPPYYYALSKGPPPSLAPISQTVDTTVDFDYGTGSATTVEVPAGTVTGSPILVHTPDVVVTEDRPGGFRLGGMTFDLQVCEDGDCVDDYVFARPVTVTLTYQDADVAGLIEEELYLLTWNGSEWVDAVADCGWPPTAYGRYPDDNRLVVPLCHFSQFALVGETYDVYLPVVLRGR